MPLAATFTSFAFGVGALIQGSSLDGIKDAAFKGWMLGTGLGIAVDAGSSVLGAWLGWNG